MEYLDWLSFFYIGCRVGTLGLDGHLMLITLHILNSVVELHLAPSSSVVIVIVSAYNVTYYMVQMF